MTIIILIIAHHFIVSNLIERYEIKGFKWFMIGGFMIGFYRRVFKLITFVISGSINVILKLRRALIS